MPKADKRYNPDFPIHEVAAILREDVRQWREPIVTRMTRKRRDPFKVLISTILSLRTKDECTAEATKRLFKLARSPQGMLRIPQDKIAKTVYPVGFYNTKAETIHVVCRDLLDRFGGKTPDNVDDLLTLKGVGRKTANLVVTLGYGKLGICVDTHVHRITNRWGYVHTKAPDETEMVLRACLPEEYWIEINDWLVSYGQNLCKPTSPWCSKCRLKPYCERRDVERSR